MLFLKIYKNVDLNYELEHINDTRSLTEWFTECFRYLGRLNIFRKTGSKLNYVKLIRSTA